ncbi:MAG: sulfur transferase domain-containing protein [Pseudomonadota bacterium]
MPRHATCLQVPAGAAKSPPMGPFLLPEEFTMKEGRKAAWRSLWLHDHGFIRKIHQNTHKISEEMWRTGQPSPGDISQWAKLGVKTVINLRGLRNNERQPGYWHLEKEACDEAGVTMIDHRAYSREAPKPAFILDLDQMFQSMAYPAVMHCKSGADRAGLGSFLYRFLREGVPFDEAAGQLSWRYGHIKSGKTGILDHFLDTYRASAVKDGTEPGRSHFLDWVEHRYDRDAIKTSFEPSALGNLLTEQILRRE